MIEKLLNLHGRLELIEDIVSGYVYTVECFGERVVFVQTARYAEIIEKMLTDWGLIREALAQPDVTLDDIRNIMGGN